MQSAELMDLIVSSGSLTAELVAGDIKDLETLIVVVLVELLDGLVLRSKATSGCRVDDKDDLRVLPSIPIICRP